MNSKRDLIYVLYYFPKISETFILQELQFFFLNKQYDLKIAAFTSFDTDYHFSNKKELLRRVTYMLKWGNSLKDFCKIFNSFFYFLRKKPIRLMKSFFYLSSLKDYSIFIIAVYFAYCYKDLMKPHLHAPFSTSQATVAHIMAYLLDASFSFTDQAGDYLQLPTNLRIKLRDCSFVFSSTRYNLNKIIEFYPKSIEKSDVVYCGVNPDCFQRKTNYSLLPLRIIMISRLVEKKGIFYLIEACSLLKQNGIDFQLSIVGDGPLEKKLREMTMMLDLNKNVIFRKAMPNEKVKEELEKSSLFILPCIVDSRGIADSQPVVLKEAMAMELPVISTPVAGIPELIQHEKNGFLVNPKSSNEIYKTIKDIVSEKYQIDRIRKNARKTVVENFDSRKEITKIENLIDIFVNKKSPKT